LLMRKSRSRRLLKLARMSLPTVKRRAWIDIGAVSGWAKEAEGMTTERLFTTIVLVCLHRNLQYTVQCRDPCSTAPAADSEGRFDRYRAHVSLLTELALLPQIGEA